MVKKLLISGTNLITYLILGLLLIFYGIQLYEGKDYTGLSLWTGALFVLLSLSLTIGFCLAHMFPDRRSSQFAFLFNVIEGVSILIVTLAGLELSEKAAYAVTPLDSWQITELGQILVNGREIFTVQPAVTDAMIMRPGAYASARLISFVLKLSGSQDIMITYFILAVHIACAYAAYRISRLLSGRVASVSVYAICMLLPSQICISSVRCWQLFAGLFSCLSLWAFHYSRRIARMEVKEIIRLLVLFLSGIFSGCAIFIHPAAIILPFAQTYFICSLQLNR